MRLDQPHSSDLRKGRISLPSHCYALTKCAAQQGVDWLVQGEVPQIIVRAIRWRRDKGRIKVLGYCIMPDHLHWIVGLLAGTDLSEMCRQFGSFTARACSVELDHRASFWQEGFYDHLLRDRAQYDRHLAYVHDSPVRRGLTESACEWPYSTAHPSLAADIDWNWWA